MNNWNRIYKPIVVLTVICIVITGALAVTNSVTAPIIAAANERAQNEALYAMLPEADGFTRAEGEWSNVSAVYVANNGAGMVVTSTGNGKNGAITVMTAFAGGTIKEIKIMDHAEDAGIGTKATDDASYLAQFAGKEAQPLTLGTDINAVATATLSSRGILDAVNNGILAFNAVNGTEVEIPTVEVDPAVLEAWQQTGLEMLSGASSLTPAAGAWSGVSVVLQADNGGYVIASTGSGIGGDVTVLTAISGGSIVEVRVVSHGETPGYGEPLCAPGSDFCQQFAGKSAQTLALGSDINAVSGATITSTAITNAVNSAVAAYNEIA